METKSMDHIGTVLQIVRQTHLPKMILNADASLGATLQLLVGKLTGHVSTSSNALTLTLVTKQLTCVSIVVLSQLALLETTSANCA